MFSKKNKFLVAVFIFLIIGTCVFSNSMSNSSFTVEILAGERISDFVQALDDAGIVSVTVFTSVAKTFNLSAYPYIKRAVNPSRTIILTNPLLLFEGVFVPGTYTVSMTTSDEEVRATLLLNKLLLRVEKRFQELHERQSLRGLSSYEIVILSSIVEKEDAYDDCAGNIASVFWNRFKKHSKLQSCPTVEYSLGYHRPFLLYKDLDLAMSSPWNTYTHKGLPPTPICFVSDYTLEETIASKQTTYWYFVMDWVLKKATFTDSYEQHLKNVAVAREHVIEKYGSTIIHQKMNGYFYDYFLKNPNE